MDKEDEYSRSSSLEHSGMNDFIEEFSSDSSIQASQPSQQDDKIRNRKLSEQTQRSLWRSSSKMRKSKSLAEASSNLSFLNERSSIVTGFSGNVFVYGEKENAIQFYQ